MLEPTNGGVWGPAYPLRQKWERDVAAYDNKPGPPPAYPLRQKWVRDVGACKKEDCPGH